MELLNNINTVISIWVGIFGLAGSLFGIVSYLRNKVFASQRKQTAQLQASQPQSSPQVVSKPLSKLDWMEILWMGFEDYISAKDGSGWISALGVAAIGGLITFFVSQAISTGIRFDITPLCLTIFYVIYSAVLILFYIYFVGRRIEKKIEEINKLLMKKVKMKKVKRVN
jgi:ABC-type Na+ efflux pump permease subunit